MSRLYDALRPYIDEVGLVQDSPGGHSGNGLTYTAEAVVLLWLRGELTEDIKTKFRAAVIACELEPGLFRRHPHHFEKDQQRQDDYVALAVLAKYLDWPELAERILNYGQKRKQVFPPLPWPKVRYYYPNEKGWDAPFYPQAWLGVYPALIATLRAAVGWALTPTEQDWINYAVGYGPNKKDPTDRDSYVLAWLISTVAGPSKEALGEFHARLQAAYPGGVPDLLRNYFIDKAHPLGDP